MTHSIITYSTINQIIPFYQTFFLFHSLLVLSPHCAQKPPGHPFLLLLSPTVARPGLPQFCFPIPSTHLVPIFHHPLRPWFFPSSEMLSPSCLQEASHLLTPSSGLASSTLPSWLSNKPHRKPTPL